MLLYLIHGLLVGLVIAAPVGPIAMLCISRTLSDGRAAGFATGMGAAFADSIYGAIAGFGLTALANLLEEHSLWLRVGGGVILIAMGARTLFAPPQESRNESLHGSLLFDFTSTFFLTLANPITLVVTAAMFAGMGAIFAWLSAVFSNLGPVDPDVPFAFVGVMVLGVFLGSLAWWLFLVFSSNAVRGWFSADHMRWVHRIGGGGISLFGVAVIISGILELYRKARP